MLAEEGSVLFNPFVTKSPSAASEIHRGNRPESNEKYYRNNNEDTALAQQIEYQADCRNGRDNEPRVLGTVKLLLTPLIILRVYFLQVCDPYIPPVRDFVASLEKHS
jgi:hypothetical protein